MAKWIPSEPMSDEGGYLTLEQAYNIIDNEQNPKHKMFLKTLLYTGRRVSEIVKPYGPTPKDINLGEGKLAFIALKKKSREKHYKFVPEHFLAELVQYTKDFMILPTDCIFPFTRQNALKIVRNAGARVGIYRIGLKNKRLHPHHFRHTFSINWLRKDKTGEGIIHLQDQLDHSDIRTTMQYAKFAMTDKKEMVRKIWE